jgi:hypothetical protein
MTTKKRLKDEILELGYELSATQDRLAKAREEADKAEKRLASMQLGIALGEAIGEGWVQCVSFNVGRDITYYENYSMGSYFTESIPMQARYSATLDLVGEPNALLRFGNRLMGR